MTTKELLQKARALIIDPQKWTKIFAARDQHGTPVSPSNKDACQWCAIGAISRIRHSNGLEQEKMDQAFETLIKCIRYLDGELNGDFTAIEDNYLISEFNDHPHTTHTDVLRVLAFAIHTVNQP